jgi:hypothetical protein
MRDSSFAVILARSSIAKSLPLPYTENIANLDLGECGIASVRVHGTGVGTGQAGSEGGTDEEAGNDADEFGVHNELWRVFWDVSLGFSCGGLRWSCCGPIIDIPMFVW